MGGSDKEIFEFDGYQLVVGASKTVPEYDATDPDNNILYVRIGCTDEAGVDSVERDVKVNIEAFNDPPSLDSVSVDIFENTQVDHVVGAPMSDYASDEETDDGLQQLTYSITKGNKKK